MIPIVLVIFVIMGIPLIRAIYWSFTDKVVGSDPNFIGLKNYIGLFQDKVYWKSLRNTAIYTGVHPGETAAGVVVGCPSESGF